MQTRDLVSCLLSIIAIAACGYDPRRLEDDGDPADRPDAATPGPDSSGAGSGTPDAAPLPACNVGLVNQSGVFRGTIGGVDSNSQALGCADPAERIVGIAFRMSDGITQNGGISAHGVQIACARVTVDGTGMTGPSVMREVTGTGTLGWTPATLTPVARCQPGWVMSEIRAEIGPSSNLFREVWISCSEVLQDGRLGMTETFRVEGTESGVTSNTFDFARCADGEVMARLVARTGAGIDALEMYCQDPVCM